MCYYVFFTGYTLRGFLFFFSSRRRHTRWNCDWSSDVCSSDLGCEGDAGQRGVLVARRDTTLLGELGQALLDLRPRALEDGPVEIAQHDGVAVLGEDRKSVV